MTDHEVTGITAERVRNLCALLIGTDHPAKRDAAVILAGLPPRDILGVGRPPFVELCWKLNDNGSLFDNCDRRAGHSGWHTWDKSAGQAPF